MQVLAAEFAERAAHTPEALAIVDESGSHTIGEIVAAARSFSEAIGEFVDGAPTVLVQADNSWRTLATAIGVGMRGGLIAVISRHASPSEFNLACEDLLPDVVVASEDVVNVWAPPTEVFEAVTEILDGWILRSKRGTTAGSERWRGGSIVAMTSGSTGRPKCVIQSEDAVRYAAQSTIDAVGLVPGDAVGALVPLSSVAAFCFGMYLPAMLGGTMVGLDSWKPDAAVALMESQQVSWTMLVPTMALQLSMVEGSEGSLASLKAMTVGGGPMDTGALERAESKLGTKFLRVFGMSECLGHTTPLPTDPVDIRLGRDGRPFPGTDLRVVDEAGNRLDDGLVGLAQVKGPSLFVGYARGGEPQPPELTEDGYFTTGDLARLNPDGTISIVGREKQIIIRGGRNIDINQVEAAIAGMPEIAQVCVVPVPDPLLGERAAALVVTDSAQLTFSQVTDYLENAGVPKYNWPEFVHIVLELPQNRVGKLSRPDAIAIAKELSTTQTTR